MEAILIQILADYTGMGPALIDKDSLLSDDLGLDSLDQIELLLDLEDKTGIYYNPGLLDGVKTVGDLLQKVTHE